MIVGVAPLLIRSILVLVPKLRTPPTPDNRRCSISGVFNVAVITWVRASKPTAHTQLRYSAEHDTTLFRLFRGPYTGYQTKNIRLGDDTHQPVLFEHR